MADYDPANLGRAVASLGLDFDFLSKGGLKGFSVPEKSQLVNGIIDENLKRGRWQAVLAMIYGGFSNVDVLYDGDHSELKNGVLESAQRSPGSLTKETIKALKDKGEQEFLFRLATEAPFDYETLGFLRNSIGNYLSDPEQGGQRTKKLWLVLGRAAFENKNLEEALEYFEEVEDREGIGKIFKAVVSGKEISDEYSRGDLGERAALADPTQKERKLRGLVLAALPKKGNISPWKAFKIFKKYDVPLSLRQRNVLYNRAAEKMSIHSVREANDSELSLLWAKKNTDSDPPEAYSILNKEEPDGEDVLKAASSGIKYDSDSQRREYYGLPLSQISEVHLKKLLLKAPFDVRVKIARHFKDEKALRNLSREAIGLKNFREAYNLWVEGKGNLKDSDISEIRTKLITGRVSGSEIGYLFSNFKEDPVGAVEYYDALIKKGNFKEAHEVALDLGDEQRAQRTREKLLEGDLEKTLSFFTCFHDKVKGEKEIEHVAEKVAETHSVPTGLVKEIIAKHHPYLKK
jgi:hypothetical protein